MASQATLRRIGIVNQAAAGWAAATSYTRMLLFSLGDACRETDVELCFLSSPENSNQAPGRLKAQTVNLNPLEYFPGERGVRSLLRLPAKTGSFRGEARLRHLLRLPDKSDLFFAARENGIDVLLPLFDVPPWDTGLKVIGWIPDFQHVHLPEYFTEADRARRDKSMRRLSERATLLMLSSRAAEAHFTAFAPAQAHKARVVSFPSLFAFEPPAGDALAARDKFNVPEKFALVANQFWAHKNHALVIAALGLLKKKGLHIPLVMTGLLSDYRDPSNQNLSRLLQSIAAAGLSGQVTILGQVPYADLVDLMRAAALVIQPSRFEGWSTIVQDAIALGRPLLCSDIAVHLEQAPNALGFFPCDDAASLAALLAEHWPGLKPGPDLEAEAAALQQEREFARRHGQTLLAICREACLA
jgi:glycosyltransferase involved in cell wall biosynthesis